jgi:hypothetical protein
MADINWTSPGAIVGYCVIGAAGIGYVLYKSKGSDSRSDSFDNPIDNTDVPNRIFPTIGGKKSRRNKSKQTNKTRNKKYKRS